MAGTPWRLHDDVAHVRRAAAQMTADLALLDEVAAGAPPALRLYRWHRPALSIGRFQALEDVDAEACARHGVEVVRRPTGGKGLLHGGDLTYAVALPAPPGEAGRVDAVYGMLAAGIIAGLDRLGVHAAVAHHGGAAGPVCFAGQQGADLRVGDRKLCGSAQVRRGDVVLQHGSILLQRLALDETDLVHPGPDGREAARARLRRVTVTLAELGGPTDPAIVGAAVVEGFRVALDIDFTSRVVA